ncbi:cystine/glutamate transporter [Biomphalaria pfeifferi]|uniref:Cystine/glutamate transporter n=1 Tax=Biomphalaria pfeifferi TaxID=112525 RepID=A0AAD8EWA2_BIOPF|nr:cystine/glutamate transporter [Biomphalaria pfeifferi]
MIMWTAGGFMQASMATCVMEVALMFHKAGGPYYFVYQTFGDLPGFVFMWGYLIFLAAPSWALGAYTTSLYSLSMVYKNCSPPEELVKLLAAWIMISVIAINCTYMKVITVIQKFLTSCKVIALIIIIILGLMQVPTDIGQEHIYHFMDGTNKDVGHIALALFAAFYGFGGWPIITILTEEVKKPERDLPRGLGFSFLFLITTMVAANFAYFTVLSKEDALKSDAVAMLFARMIHPVLPFVLVVLICLCSIGTLNVLILSQSRMIFAAGRNGHMPRFMTMLHKKFHTPWPATFALGSLAIVMLLTAESIESLISVVSLYTGLMILILLMCFFTLRWKSPTIHRPIRVPLILPILATILTVFLIVVSVKEKTQELGFVALVVFLGVPVYFICINWQKPANFFRHIDTVGKYIQLSLNLHYENAI